MLEHAPRACMHTCIRPTHACALCCVRAHQIMSSSGSMRTFLAEREIARHELTNRLYALPAYFAARSYAEAKLHAAFATLFGCLTYPLVGFGATWGQLGCFLAVVVLVTLTAESYVVLVGALMPDDKAAAVVGPLFLALFMVSGRRASARLPSRLRSPPLAFSRLPSPSLPFAHLRSPSLSLSQVSGGLFVNVGSVPWLFQQLNALNPFVYAFDALAQNELAGLALTCEHHELIGPPPPAGPLRLLGGEWPERRCPITNGDEVLARMGLGARSRGHDCLALVAMVVAYRAAAFLALRARFRTRV